MSTLVPAEKLKLDAISSLAACFISLIGLITLIEHFKQHHILWKQVKIFAIMSHLCLFIMSLIDGMFINNSIFTDFHKHHDIISNCFPLFQIAGGCYLFTRYFMMAFSLSRLRYFFHSRDLELNKTLYYGLLSFNLLITLSIFIYFILNIEIIVVESTHNKEIKKCAASQDDNPVFFAYVIIMEGLMQCLTLYLYYRTYKKFLMVYHIENIDDKYVKRHVVKRSLLLGIFSIICTFVFAVFAGMELNEFTDHVLGVLMLAIQICCVVFSFDIKCGLYDGINGGQLNDGNDIDNNGLIEMGLRSGLSVENEEYLQRVMRAFHRDPRDNDPRINDTNHE